jgi:glycosyltransferase involved in cell wall biosynthesis
MKKIKILIVAKRLPYPLLTGGDQAQFNILTKLQDVFGIYLTYNVGYNKIDKKAYEEFQRLCPLITVLPYMQQKKGQKKIVDLSISIAKRIILKLYPKKRKTQKVEDYLYGEGSYYKRHYSVFINFVSECIERYQIDILQTEFNMNIDIVFLEPPSVKTIFIHHELRFVRNQRYLETNNINDVANRYRYNFLKNEEISTLNHYDKIIVFSQTDKELLKSNGVVKDIDISMPTVSEIKEKSDYGIKENTLTFIGPSLHSSNVDGLMWFLENVWALIKKSNLSVKLNIIGKWDKHLSANIIKKYQDIHFLGFVDDLTKEISGTVMIVPILIGSGVRMKILEAANREIPVISTTVGIEGLGFTDKKNALIADDPHIFAENVLLVLKNREQREYLSQNAKKHFETNYSLETVANRRKLIIENLFSNQNEITK